VWGNRDRVTYRSTEAIVVRLLPALAHGPSAVSGGSGTSGMVDVQGLRRVPSFIGQPSTAPHASEILFLLVQDSKKRSGVKRDFKRCNGSQAEPSRRPALRSMAYTKALKSWQKWDNPNGCEMVPGPGPGTGLGMPRSVDRVGGPETVISRNS
jgi:hypothetical protein